MNFALQWLHDILIGDPMFGGVPRSSQWPKVRNNFLKTHPTCAVCGGTNELNVHHKKPYHLFPEFELDPNNLITLCNHSLHHITFGHLGDFSSYNESIEVDATIWQGKFSSRPKGRTLETDN